ncbi:MAG: sulfotransferase [Bacteroidota bacterium]
MASPRENLQPILISSPVRRSGTTLIQRLLCSAPNCLIFGESCANDVNTFVNLFQAKQLSLQSHQAFREEVLQRVLAGEVNDWIADLMPTAYLEAMEEACFKLVVHQRDFAVAQGRPVWGMKMAEWNLNMLVQLCQLLPKAKVIYITRGLEDCIRSAKRVNMIQGPMETQQFAQTWQQGPMVVQQYISADRLLMLSYESLLAQPAQHIEQLAQFSGAEGIDPTVLQHRINTFRSDLHRDPSGKGWMAPEDLDESDRAIIQQYTYSGPFQP